MGDSAFRKLQKILEKPQPPAYMRGQEYTRIPWYQRAWEAVRPPAAVPTQRAPMTPTQRRMVWITSAIVVALVVTWWGYDYGSKAPERARMKYIEAMRAQAVGDFNGAIDKFSDSLAIVEDANTYLQRGNAYKYLGKMDKASDDWSHAIGINGQLAEAYVARATFFRDKGETSRALQDLEQSLKIVPSMEGFFQLGDLYVSESKYDQAITSYTRAIELMPTAPYIYLARAKAKRAIGDAEGADADLKKGLELQGAK